MTEERDIDVVGRNKVYWELLAPHRTGEPVEFFQSGGSALSEAEIAVIGDVRGKRVLQLAGSVGDEGITFAQLGAQVTVVDLAAPHLATGQTKAQSLGLDVTFLEQDMMSLDPSLTGFDVVYISTGGICWAPDITEWAHQVSQRLGPGGLLVVQEHHPLWEILTVDSPGRLSVTGSYFAARRDGYTDELKAPQVTRELSAPPVEHTSFVWSISSVVEAVLGAGMTIRSLQEFSERDLYPGLGDDALRLPATHLLSAMR